MTALIIGAAAGSVGGLLLILVIVVNVMKRRQLSGRKRPPSLQVQVPRQTSRGGFSRSRSRGVPRARTHDTGPQIVFNETASATTHSFATSSSRRSGNGAGASAEDESKRDVDDVSTTAISVHAI